MDDSMPLRDLTVVLPTYNRVELLRRALDHYASQRLAARFIVADSSSEPHLAANKAVIEALRPRLAVEHIVYPSDIVQIVKMRDAVYRVATPYVVMAADDDFFTVAGLERAVEFLTAHPD